MFHYLFPPLTIGLGVLLVIVEGLFLRTGDPAYEAIARFWTRLFAVNFAMGVATGVVMEFEFGTNWAAYSRFVGDVFGSALAAEGVFAFFLESGFLGVMLFGWSRVSPRFHFFSTTMVCLGGVFSSIWIVIANSWMQTPAGYRLVPHGGGVRAEIHDFWAMIFNPSSMDRLVHVWLGCFILGAFFAMSIAAWYVLRQEHGELARRMFVIALWFGAISSTAMLASGDSNARMVARYQPAKLAAMEGHYTTGEGPTRLFLFGWPDDETQEVFGIALPGMLSLLVYRNLEQPVPGLDRVPRDEWPPVFVTFQAYHLMIGLGMYFIAITWYGLWQWKRGRLFEQRWLMWLFVFSVLGAYAANQCGWVTAEVGRQPWIVYGLMRTGEGLSTGVHGHQVLSSLLGFGFVYLLLFIVWVFVMNDKIQHGPELPTAAPPARTWAEGILDSAADRTDPGAH
ncbi:MAG: cytochrome ubiquinol oxidase subunit I [Armatimonadetes bacterium]|nr:cytochrome ubiquinol oxidase subunit I [Armatimonadota bacterium]